MYDVYQQSLASDQTSVIQPFEPIKVLKARDVLGDSMTPCSKVEVGDQVYYLLLNGRGHLAGSPLLGMVKVFRNVTFMNDTVEVLESRRVPFQDPLRKIHRFLNAGDLCVRYFSIGGSVYSEVVGGKANYVWLRLSPAEKNKLWKVAETRQPAQNLSPMIRERVLKRIRQANLTYAELYAFLDNRTNTRLPLPQWNVQTSGSSIVCTLLPDSAARGYSQSIQALSTTLQTYLLGTGYTVASKGNRIFIKR